MCAIKKQIDLLEDEQKSLEKGRTIQYQGGEGGEVCKFPSRTCCDDNYLPEPNDFDGFRVRMKDAYGDKWRSSYFSPL
jgi:hypothetical protein